MKYQLFQFAIPHAGDLVELNQFLSSHRIVSVRQSIVRSKDNPLLLFIVEYVDGAPTRSSEADCVKVDYRKELTPEQFSLFSLLRDERKKIAEELGVPVYTILTNAQLAHIVRDNLNTLSALSAVTGLGAARAEKFGARWLKQTMRVKRYLRYMDDMLCIGCGDHLSTVLREIPSFLESIGLRLSNSCQLNACRLGVPWLGFVIYPNRIRLNAQGRQRLRRRTRKFEKLFTAGTISELELQQRTTSMFAHAAYADDIRWRRRFCSGKVLSEFV